MKKMTLPQALPSSQGENSFRFATCFKLYGKDCVAYLVNKFDCPQMEAEDIMMDAMIDFREKNISGKITEVANQKAYLFTTCRNMWFKSFAKKGRERSKEDDIYRYFYEYRYEGESDPIANEKNRSREIEQVKNKVKNIQEALRQLDAKCQEVLRSFCMLNQSMKEIAAKMGFASADVAKTTKSRCYQKWRSKIEVYPLTSSV